MFESADTLMPKNHEKKNEPVHFIGYKWEGFTPKFYGYDKEEAEVIGLDLWNLSHNFSYAMTCTGSWHDGQYVPCPSQNKVFKFAVCDDCATAFIPIQDCIFEPQCDGQKCDKPEAAFCKQEHVVYASFQGHLAKIGMTTAGRIKQRQIEQGADAYVILAKVEGRLSARDLEVMLSSKLKTRQYVRMKEYLAMMSAPPDTEAIEKNYEKLAGAAEKLGHKAGALRFLDGYPIDQPLETVPELARERGHHVGRVLGFKGKFVFYLPEDGKIRALNLQKCVSRTVRRVDI